MLKGRHWVFIIGFISAVITSIWSEYIAINILSVLVLIGVGMVIVK